GRRACAQAIGAARNLAAITMTCGRIRASTTAHPSNSVAATSLLTVAGPRIPRFKRLTEHWGRLSFRVVTRSLQNRRKSQSASRRRATNRRLRRPAELVRSRLAAGATRFRRIRRNQMDEDLHTGASRRPLVKWGVYTLTGIAIVGPER